LPTSPDWARTDKLKNTAKFTYKTSTTATVALTANRTITIVEPDLEITKTDTKTTAYAPGAVITYTDTVANCYTGAPFNCAAADVSTAFTVVVSDTLPTGEVVTKCWHRHGRAGSDTLDHYLAHRQARGWREDGARLHGQAADPDGRINDVHEHRDGYGQEPQDNTCESAGSFHRNRLSGDRTENGEGRGTYHGQGGGDTV